MDESSRRVADAFNARFDHWESIRIAAEDVVIGNHRVLGGQGWHVRFRVDPDDGGHPSLQLYATHRMTNDSHVRIRSDGHVEDLDAIWEAYAYDAKVPGDRERAHDEYLRHNRAVADELRARGLYPDGDLNAFLRTGGMDDEHEPEA